AATVARPAAGETAPGLRLITPEIKEQNIASHAVGTRAHAGSTDQPYGSKRDAVHQGTDLNDPVTQLRAMDLDRLLAGLEGEHAQTVATVINCLDPQAAGEILKRLPADTRRLVFLRLGQTSSSPLDLVPRIVQAIVQKCHALAESPIAEKGDAKYQKLAEVLKRLD